MAKVVPSRFQFSVAGTGVAIGYKLFTYQAGSTTKQTTYQDADQNSANTNPIVLDENGSCALFSSVNLKLVLAPPTDSDPPVSPVWTMDEVDMTGNLLDSSGNIVIAPIAVANAANYWEARNAASGGVIDFRPNGSDSNPSMSFSDKAGNKILKLDSSGATSVNYVDIKSNTTTNGPHIFPNGSDSNPVLNISDKNIAPIHRFSSPGANAVNYLISTSATTGNNPFIQVTGSDSNPSLLLKDKTGNTVATFAGSTSSTVNYLTFSGATTGNNPSITAAGSDTNISLTLSPKGTGSTLIAYSDTRTNTVGVPLTVQALTSGTATTDLGTGILFQAEDAAGNTESIGQINFAFSDATNTSEDTYADLQFRVAGNALASRFRFASTSTTSKITFTHAATADRTVTLGNNDTNLTNVIVFAYNSATFSCTTSSTKAPYNTEVFDTNSNFDTSTNRFTPTVAGYYLVYAQQEFPFTTNATGTIAVSKNGSLVQNATAVNLSGGSANIRASVSTIVQLNGSTDYIEIFQTNNVGTITIATDQTKNYMYITKLV